MTTLSNIIIKTRKFTMLEKKTNTKQQKIYTISKSCTHNNEL